MSRIHKRGAELLADMLHGYGITHIFYMPSLAVHALAAMEDLGIRRVVTHGEKAAAYMADGFARASRGPSVCMSQHIGASNLAAGLRDAYMAGSPVIALSGGPDPRTRFRNAYQDVEDVTQFGPVTKDSFFVDTVDRLPDLLRQTFRTATSGAPGPVHLGLRGRTGLVINDELDAEAFVEPRFASTPAFRPFPDPVLVRDALNAIRGAERPIIVAGGGVIWSNAEAELVAFATQLGIPVATSLNAKHAIPDGHALSVGVVGSYSRSCANRAVAGADLVIYIGSHTGGQVTFDWKIPPQGTRVIQIDIDPVELGRNYPNTVSVLGDAKVTLAAMTEEALKTPLADWDIVSWRDHVRELVGEWRASSESERSSDAVPMRPERLCAELSDLLPEDAVLVSDTGHAGIWSGVMIELRHASQRYIRCAGSMGWGLPGAIGVKCALPDKPVICFTGDGAFYYHIAELETAARHGVKLIVVVNNNQALSQEIPGILQAYGNELRGRGKELFRHDPTDFAEVARSMGCLGYRVENADEFRESFSAALGADRPVVIDVRTDINALPEKPWA